MTNENYHGMTVNERLVACGLLKVFDEAKKRRDKDRLIEILRKVQVGEESIREILTRFGFQ